ncbi:MAG: AarF/ABC1/UbiB kinase family protein, partial [Pseudomonadota bacterium]
SDAEAMPGPQLKAALDRNWGPDWRKRFERFDVRPIAAASIGQVHRAVLKDGRELAIKVQYPGVARSIDSDVANLGALLRMAGLVPKGLDLAPYLEEARRQLHEEADYEREGARLVEYRRLIEGEPGFVAPELVEDLTRKEILAMTYIPGAPIERSEDADQATRDRIASRLIDLSLSELFEFRLMQTDSNFANFRYDAERDRIVLLDFGATRALDPQFVEDCRALLCAGLAEDRAGTRAACERLDILHEATAPAHRERIFAMVETAFEALRRDEVFDFAASDLSRRLQAEGEALALEEPTPPPVPMDALYVQRKLGGMFLLATRLRARAPVRAMLARWIEGTAAQAAE